MKATRTALNDAEELGLDFEDMCQAVCSLSLTTADFHKSMTTYQDHTIWQDVYFPRLTCGSVYLKITVIQDVLIVSFREL